MFTPRERDVLAHLVAGRVTSNKGIGRRIGMAEGTVKCHLQHAYLKLGVRNRTAAVVELLKRDLVEPA